MFGGDYLFDDSNNGFRRYDPRFDTWKPLPPSPHPKKNCACVAYKNSIYVIGGHTGDGSGKVMVFRFSLESGEWEYCPDLNNPVSSHAAAVFEDRIYISGGDEHPSDV